jgi:hypothetical protein
MGWAISSSPFVLFCFLFFCFFFATFQIKKDVCKNLHSHLILILFYFKNTEWS